ncbi:DUF4112 domain-containing protein [Haloferax namakaokahaiae]|uniref:DUF4112 domain-containing protein n=1 Tax=Haloferax namakaokahaiae TaxID=1748331 RepID=A0ABD5ZBQ5_9EURY
MDDSSTVMSSGRRHDVGEPVIVDFEETADEIDDEVMKRLRTVSFYLDNAIEIPGTNYRIGLDPFLGLIPGVGDATGTALSAYILIEAATRGVPRETLLRMFGNLLLDSTVGAVPVVGDAFDAVWKANARNVRLIESHGELPAERQAADRKFLLGAVVVITVLLLGLGITTTLAVLWFLGQFGLL